MVTYPSRVVFARTIETWLKMWEQGHMGDAEFRARLSAIAGASVKETTRVGVEREGWDIPPEAA
jgi:hypothetical protein